MNPQDRKEEKDELDKEEEEEQELVEHVWEEEDSPMKDVEDMDLQVFRLNRNKVIVFTRDMVKKVFNIPSGNRTVELYKRHEQCDLHNIYYKNGRAPIVHTMDVLLSENDDGDTTKRSWVLLTLATVLTPRTGKMVPLECLKSLEEIDKVICMDQLMFPQAAINEHQLNYSLPRACFVHQSDFDPVLQFDKNKVSLGKASFGKCRSSYAALSLEGAVTGVDVGNFTGASQDADCDDTQDCRAEDVNINENQDDVGAKDNPTKDNNPVENGKSAEENLPPHLAKIYEEHTKLYAGELKGAKNSYVQVLQAMHCRRMGQLLKDVHLASSSTQQAMDVNFDIPPPRSNDVHKADDRGGSKQSSSMKVADEPTTDKVVVKPTEGARSNHASSSAHETNGGNVANVDRYENAKEQKLSGEDVEHGPQLSHLGHFMPTSVGGGWSDAPSMSLFQEGTEEYNSWIDVPNADADSNASSHGNTTSTPKSYAVFDATPHAPGSTRIKVHTYDVTPIAIAPFSSCTVVSGMFSSKDEKKLKSKKRSGSPISSTPKYKKIKTNSKTEAMYQYFVMKRYKMKKGPPFIRIGDFQLTYSNFQNSLKPPSTFCPPRSFDPSVCAKELRRACQNFQISVFNLLFFTIVRDGHWIVCVVNLLHKKFNLFNSLDNGNLDIAAWNLFTNFKRIAAEDQYFTLETSFKPEWPLLDYPQQST
ncbi:hypothetical protein ZWY2020_026882 [Hordeum vulgare]|nr:hypothetical protein ZWY2020_026882 [Hordeum vulgare]